MHGIFVSYRRSDSADITGRIYDRLVSEFAKEHVFKDVDSISMGGDFRTHLNGAMSQCRAVLTIVGTRWTDARDDAGARRLDDPDDFVRIEVEAGLARGIPVVPVLVANATMPTEAQLPASLGAFAFRQATAVRPDPDFHRDMDRLVAALRDMLAPRKAADDTLAELLTRGSGLGARDGAQRDGVTGPEPKAQSPRPMPLDEALRHAIAIAGALDALHRQGKVHGAINPAHIALTTAGVKLVAPASTLGTGATGTGMDAAAYLSPEQLEGKDPDARAQCPRRQCLR